MTGFEPKISSSAYMTHSPLSFFSTDESLPFPRFWKASRQFTTLAFFIVTSNLQTLPSDVCRWRCDTSFCSTLASRGSTPTRPERSGRREVPPDFVGPSDMLPLTRTKIGKWVSLGSHLFGIARPPWGFKSVANIFVCFKHILISLCLSHTLTQTSLC